MTGTPLDKFVLINEIYRKEAFMNKPASLISALFIALVALGHLLRILYNLDLLIAGIPVPMWASGAAMVFCGFLAIWLFRERQS